MSILLKIEREGDLYSIEENFNLDEMRELVERMISNNDPKVKVIMAKLSTIIQAYKDFSNEIDN